MKDSILYDGDHDTRPLLVPAYKYGLLHPQLSNRHYKFFGKNLSRARNLFATLYLFSQTAGTQGKLSIAAHSSHCGECAAVRSVRRLQAVREKRYTQVYTSGNVAAGVGAEAVTQ